MVSFTASKFEIQLVAIVQAQVTTYKHFKVFHLHIEFSGTGGADACQSLLQMDVLLFYQIFSYLLAAVNFQPTFNQTVYLERVSPGVCQSMYSYNVKT
jgi:hypothetical protein